MNLGGGGGEGRSSAASFQIQVICFGGFSLSSLSCGFTVHTVLYRPFLLVCSQRGSRCLLFVRMGGPCALGTARGGGAG